MIVDESGSVLCPNCGEDYGSPEYLVSKEQPDCAMINDCDNCGELSQL